MPHPPLVTQPEPKSVADRNNAGKAPLDYNLIGRDVNELESRVWAHGGIEYAPGNWLKGVSYREGASCLLRHLTAWLNGEDLDPVDAGPDRKPGSGLHHLAHVICDAKILLNSALNRPDLDDRTVYNTEVGEAKIRYVPSAGATLSADERAKLMRGMKSAKCRPGTCIDPKACDGFDHCRMREPE